MKTDFRQPPADIAAILAGVSQASGVNLHLLKAIAFVESRFRPGAMNYADLNNVSTGLFQIRPIPWLRYLGLGSDQEILLDAMTNAQAGADIINYFEQKGFRFPNQADVYNLGETAYNAGTRNNDYRIKVQAAFDWFRSQ